MNERSFLQQNYEILNKIGSGQLGEVFAARQPGESQLARHVAYKRFRAHVVAHPSASQTLIEQQRTALGFSHDNIARIYDVGEVDDTYYIVSEQIRGHDLRSVAEAATRRGVVIPLGVALELILQVLEGVRHIHERPNTVLVHGNLTPQNVLVGLDGRVKLTDFGGRRIASTYFAALGEPPKGNALCYAAREQLDQEGIITPATDVFSIGVMLYELTAGQRLFRDTTLENAKRAVEQPVTPPSKLAEGYPTELEHVVLKALETDGAKRYATAGKMYLELLNVAASLGLSTGARELRRFARAVLHAAAPPPARPSQPVRVPLSAAVAKPRSNTGRVAIPRPAGDTDVGEQESTEQDTVSGGKRPRKKPRIVERTVVVTEELVEDEMDIDPADADILVEPRGFLLSEQTEPPLKETPSSIEVLPADDDEAEAPVLLTKRTPQGGE